MASKKKSKKTAPKAKKKASAKKRAVVVRRASKSKPAKSKAVKRKTAKRKPAPKKAATKRVAKKAPRAKKEIFGEGNYTASRNFREEETAFVKRNEAKIPAMGKAAEAALEGPQGGELRAAEAEAASRAKGGNL